MTSAIRLTASTQAWGTPEFRATLKREIEALDPGLLPLQQGLSASSYALDDKVTAVLVSSDEAAGRIRARMGLFYFGVIAGCSCADDPTPVEPQNEYCEIDLTIDRADGEATIRLAAD